MWEVTCNPARTPFDVIACINAINAGSGEEDAFVIVLFPSGTVLTNPGGFAGVLGDGAVPAVGSAPGLTPEEWVFEFGSGITTKIFLPAGVLHDETTGADNCAGDISLGG